MVTYMFNTVTERTQNTPVPSVFFPRRPFGITNLAQTSAWNITDFEHELNWNDLRVCEVSFESGVADFKSSAKLKSFPGPRYFAVC